MATPLSHITTTAIDEKTTVVSNHGASFCAYQLKSVILTTDNVVIYKLWMHVSLSNDHVVVHISPPSTANLPMHLNMRLHGSGTFSLCIHININSTS